MKQIINCENCGKQFERKRSDVRFCGQACKRAWLRSQQDQSSANQRVRRECLWEDLRAGGLVMKLWPIYTWQHDEPVYCLTMTPASTLAELNLERPEGQTEPITLELLNATLREHRVESAADKAEGRIKELRKQYPERLRAQPRSDEQGFKPRFIKQLWPPEH